MNPHQRSSANVYNTPNSEYRRNTTTPLPKGQKVGEKVSVSERIPVVEVRAVDREHLAVLNNDCIEDLKAVVRQYLNEQSLGEFGTVDKEVFIQEHDRARENAKDRSHDILQWHGQKVMAYIDSLPNHLKAQTTDLYVRMSQPLVSSVTESLTALEPLLKKRIQRLIKIRQSENEMLAKVDKIYEIITTEVRGRGHSSRDK